MLKGHTKIELTDVNTGKIQTYEHNNIVTNAVLENLSKLSLAISASNINSKLLPLNSKLMGGILLFENELSADVANTALPSPFDNKIVGYASTDAYSGEDTKRGSRNQTESMEIDGGYKYVWDFATSQGNGTISALSLTSDKCGATPYAYNSSFTTFSHNTSEVNNIISSRFTEYNFDDNTFTVAYVSDIATIKVIKARMPLNELRVNSVMGVPEVISSTDISLADVGISANTSAKVVNSNDNYYYVVYAASKKMYIFRFDKETLAIDTNYGYKTISTTESFSVNSSNSNVIVYNNYLYVAYSTQLLKFNINDYDDNSSILGLPSSANSMCICNNSIVTSRYIYFEDGSGNYEIVLRPDSSTGIIQGTTPNSVDITASGLCIEAFYNSSSSQNQHFIGSTLDYLATINNLDTPIVKTSAQTMKITYTLTEI